MKSIFTTERVRLFTAYCAFVLAVNAGTAQVLVSNARVYGVSPRGFALADAYCADNTDVTSMYGNPGALGYLRNTSVVLTHQVDWTTQSATEQLAVPYQLNRDISLGVAAVVSRDGKLRAENGADFAFNSYGIDLGSSVRIMPTLTAGLLLGARSYTFADQTMTTGWVQVGVLYNPTPGITYGASYRIRNNLLCVIAGPSAFLVREPTWPAELEIGAAMTFPSHSGTPIVTLALTTEKNFPSIQRFNTKGGLEVYPIPSVALRLGYKVGSSVNVGRYGAGVRFGKLQMDVGIAPSSAEERSHVLSLSYSL
jgi:hypothetical protein